MSVHVNIEHGIPIPGKQPRQHKSSSLRATFTQMAIGDSFTIDNIHWPAVRSAAHHTHSLITPRDVPGSKTLIRVWKTGEKQNGATP